MSSAYGYAAQVSLFGGPQPADGPNPSVTLATDASNSPQTATAPSGQVRHGPANFFTSGQLDVSSQATTGTGGSVTSGTNIANINTSGDEVFTAGAVTSSCTASEAGGASGTTTITRGTLQTDSGDDDGDVIYPEPGEHDPVNVPLPTNPAPNTAYDGHIHVNGSQDNFRYVFNQQVTNLDGSITVYAAHQYLLGPTAVGDLWIGKSECDATGTEPTTTTTTQPTTTTTAPSTTTTTLVPPVTTTLPTVPTTLPITPPPVTTQFCNPAPITQPNSFTFVSGASVPYPSPIVVSGLTGVVKDVNMTLRQFTTEGQPWPEDMDIMAAAPDNSNVILMSDAGGNNWDNNQSTTAADLTFDDQAAEQLPADGHITAGTWRPVDDDEDYAGDTGNPDTWPVPAPPLTDTTLLSTFHEIDPNGTWNLFANDDQVLGSSDILGGWCIDITTGPPNIAPVATNDTYTTNEDTSLTVAAPGVLANDTDANGDSLRSGSASGPANGSVVLNADGSFTYTPDANFNGTDTFTYKANDGIADSNVATVSVTVNAVNDNPVATADAYTTVAGRPISLDAPGVLANDTDVDGNALTAGSATVPVHGTVRLNANGSFTYTPKVGFNGTDTFNYTARDGNGGSATATVTVLVHPPPTLSVDDIALNEGDTGTKAATFTVTRTGDTSGASSVKVHTAGGTATAGTDYVAVPLTTVSFAPGEASKTVGVTVYGDTAAEANETFALVLSAPTGATISDTSGLATILTDDAPPSLAINDVSVREGNAGTTPATFTITRTGNTTGPSTVKYKTANGTAVAGSDYTGLALTTVNFVAGETSKTLSVDVIGETAKEANETFRVYLSTPTFAVLSDNSGLGTIVNDD